MRKRILCLWLPSWSLQRVVVERPDLRGQPLVLYATQPRRGQRVVCCSAAASDVGIRVGMSLAEASAVQPPGALAGNRDRSGSVGQVASLHFVPQDLEADRQCLEELAACSQRYSPVVGLEAAAQPACLLLDITGSAPRLGGESGLVSAMAADFHRWGYVVRIAVADTLGAAWALAHYGELEPLYRGGAYLGQTLCAPSEQLARLLEELPLAALRLELPVRETLEALGILRIGELLKLPRAGLAARFPPQLLQRLDQAWGVTPEPFEAFQALPPLELAHDFEHATADRARLEQSLRVLTEQLAQRLQQRRQGALQLACHLCMSGIAAAEIIQVGLFQPTSQPQRLFELVQAQLQHRRLPAAICRLVIRVVSAARLVPQQPGLLPDSWQAVPAQLRDLIERLSSRMGVKAVVFPQLQAEPLPEQAFRYLPLTTSLVSSKLWLKRQPQLVAESSVRADGAGLRPLRLFQPAPQIEVVSTSDRHQPDRFHYQGHTHRVTQWWGPERLETGWWRGPTVRRDYFRVEDEGGGRFWIFRELHQQTWFLQGMFT